MIASYSNYDGQMYQIMYALHSEFFQLMHEMGSSKALLEVQYENEVGTGLGPTLEFYALVSKDLQKSDLELWSTAAPSSNEYVHNPLGLFPMPLARSAKVSHVTKIRSKFRFLGKFMAKAVMDSRMVCNFKT